MTAAEVVATYGPTIQSVAGIIGVPSVVGGTSNYVNLVASIITRESGGDPNIIGDNGCSYGLMQLNTCAGWLPGYGFGQDNSALLDPATNINYGCQYLNTLLNQYGNVNQAISAYNAGSPTTANTGYVNAVLGYLKQLGGFVTSNPIIVIAGLGVIAAILIAASRQSA